MKNTNLIPTNFTIGGQNIDVKNTARCTNNEWGVCSVGIGYIEIADFVNRDLPQSDSSKVNTFFHELVHCILDTMGQKDLSCDEIFVSSFAGFLTEAMTTADYPEDVFNKMLLELKTNPISTPSV